MPVSIETRPELDLTIFTASGAAPYNELMQALETFYNGSPTVYEIWDCSRVTEINILSRELREIVQYAKRQSDRRPGGYTALIADTTLKSGLARMTTTFAELAGLPLKMKIFKDLDSALEWITECRHSETQEIQTGNDL